MKPLHIRKSNLADMPAIIALYQQPDMDNGNAVTADKAEALFHKIASYPDYQFYVATLATETEDKIVGVFGLLIMDNFGHCGTPSAIVEGVCVEENYQGKGIGKAMMKAAQEKAKAAGCYKLALTSNIKREQAHRFYRSLGFEQHGISFQIDL